ncbi:hypothetical protein ACFW04_014452 [Cataglyphis niger]
MHNIKKSYKNIKNNKKFSTSRGRISWEYFETFKDIFRSEKSMRISSLYNIRKKLDIEEKRIKPIMELKTSIDNSNKIQQERNDLL